MTDGALHGQVKQLRISLENEFEETRQCLGGKLDSVDAKLDKLDSKDAKLDRLIGIAEQVIEDEPWKGEQ